MKSGIALFALSITGIAHAGQFDLIHGIARDVNVGDPVASGRTVPTVMNGDFAMVFGTASADPIGAASAVPGFDVPMRRTRTIGGGSPIGFERSMMPLELPSLDADLGTVGMELRPTGGAVALLTADDLGMTGPGGG